MRAFRYRFGGLLRLASAELAERARALAAAHDLLREEEQVLAHATDERCRAEEDWRRRVATPTRLADWLERVSEARALEACESSHAAAVAVQHQAVVAERGHFFEARREERLYESLRGRALQGWLRAAASEEQQALDEAGRMTHEQRRKGG